MLQLRMAMVVQIVTVFVLAGSINAQYEFVGESLENPTMQRTGCKSNCNEGYFSPEQCAGKCYNNCCFDDCGRYFRAFGGWNWLDSLETEAGNPQVPGVAESNDGWGMGTAIGKYITPLVRRELEFSYRHNSAAEIGFPMLAPIPLDGNVRSYSIMGNLIRELNIGNQWRLTPYVGGGVGIVFVDGNMTGGGDDYVIDATAFGYQGLAGVGRQIGARTTAFAEYRYLGTSNIDIAGPAATTADRYSAHNLFFGLQFHR